MRGRSPEAFEDWYEVSIRLGDGGRGCVTGSLQMLAERERIQCGSAHPEFSGALERGRDSHWLLGTVTTEVCLCASTRGFTRV